MERLRGMGLRKSFFLLSAACLLAALLLTLGIYLLCGRIEEAYPKGGVVIASDGTVTWLDEPDR